MLTPPPVTVLRGHTDAVNSISFFSPSYLLSGYIIVLYYIYYYRLYYIKMYLYIVFVSSLDGKIKVFDVQSRRAIIDITAAHEDSVLSVAGLSHSGSFIR
jgi:WD40 repeat protein